VHASIDVWQTVSQLKARALSVLFTGCRSVAS